MLSEGIENYLKSMMVQVRSNRNILLRETDWTQIADAPLSEEKKTEYAAYRQLLRDITENCPDPINVVWPARPE